jgi:pimeloyl-ACP methyl ester carboxylesterase
MKLILKSGHSNLSANIIRPENKKGPLPALIFVHGWKSSQEGNIKRAEQISKLGYVCLTLDLRGHGESDGKIDEFSREDHIDDIKAAYQHLLGLSEVDPENIGILGSSYGGYLSAVALNYLKFKFLVLRVPALYFNEGFDIPTDKLIKENPQAFKSSDLTPDNCLALKGVNNFSGKILLIESEKDEIIPHQVIENYLREIKKENLTYLIMKGAGHHFWNHPEFDVEYLQILKNWLGNREEIK